jgi:hypothetical protein
LLLEIGEDMTRSSKQRFATATDPDGQAWAPNSALTLANYSSMFARKKDGTLTKASEKKPAAKSRAQARPGCWAQRSITNWPATMQWALAAPWSTPPRSTMAPSQGVRLRRLRHPQRQLSDSMGRYPIAQVPWGIGPRQEQHRRPGSFLFHGGVSMASKRRIRRNACTGKYRYDSAADAQAAIFGLHRRKGHQGYLQPYRCSCCNGYHFGHPPKSKRKFLGNR